MPLLLKLRETELNLDRLSGTVRRREFYANVNAFLASARSILYVARHQFGWEELRAPDRSALSSSEELDRKRFDAWYKSASTVHSILAHPLVEERHEVIHRKGQAGFSYAPKPVGGLALEEGDAFRPTLFIRRARSHIGRTIGLALEDNNTFYYQTPDGQKHDAVSFCRKFFQLLQDFCSEVQARPWTI